MAAIASSQLKVGLEIHVQLATRTKLFSRAPSPAHPKNDAAPPNSCIDPVVLGLPGALPVANRQAVRMSMMVGLALRCSIAPVTRWDRKSYFYPDLPKGYQISQFDLPLCFDGAFDLPAPKSSSGAGGQSAAGGPVPIAWDSDPHRIGIIRAHLEEDAGKLLHEVPGGGGGGPPIDFSLVDCNRAGTPLLEIVTQPDFRSADAAVLFCQLLRSLCRFLGVTEGILQKGHMRFEPNINCVLTLDDGHSVHTPIVEVKNLNSFRALRGAIEFEAREQPRRWEADRRVMGPGSKQTRGWDDLNQLTFVQREKEDAHDYRYFPDPDLLPVQIPREWVEEIKAALPELPLPRQRRYIADYGLGPKEAAALVDERDVCLFFESCIADAVKLGLPDSRAGKAVANILLQSAAKRANQAADLGFPVLLSRLGISSLQVAGLAKLREEGKLSNAAIDELFGYLCDPSHEGTDAQALAEARGLLTVRDDAALSDWVQQAIADNPQPAADVRAGKDAAIGRLIGAVMKLSAGKADAKTAREQLLKHLGRS